MSDVPDPTAPLEKGDILVVVGTDQSVQRLLKLGMTHV